MPRKKFEVIQAGPMMLLPPAKGKCQTCAVAHKPEHPHDATSIYYGVKFKMETGKDPTWEDAMQHCSEDVKEHWRKELKALFQVDTHSTQVRGSA